MTYGSPMEMYLSWGLVSPISTAFLFDVIFVEYILSAWRPNGRAYKLGQCGCLAAVVNCTPRVRVACRCADPRVIPRQKFCFPRRSWQSV